MKTQTWDKKHKNVAKCSVLFHENMREKGLRYVLCI